MHCPKGITGGTDGKEPACRGRMQGTKDTQVQSLYWEDPLAEETATHSSTLAGELHGQGRRAGYSLCSQTQSQTRPKRLSPHGRTRYTAWPHWAERSWLKAKSQRRTKLPFSKTPENWEELPTNVFSLLTYFPIRDKTQMSPTVWKQCVAMTTNKGYVLTESHDTEQSLWGAPCICGSSLSVDGSCNTVVPTSEKYPHISGSAQSKPRLFKGQHINENKTTDQ